MMSRRVFSAPLLSLLLLALTGCDDAEACKTKSDCIKQGKCTPDKNGVCVVSSDQDCKSSELCKKSGKCSAK